MYLEKLQLLGFKSFAKKTSFFFNEGITGVVGPNGCGKSNIVDAIRWVLGEQKAGTLRSERMENVIFNGAGNGKPLGMAEVSLTIQNTHNVLPIEFSEVVITRRLFRSGESQYLLNNNPCRLKDIVDLFMDTGMGANAYSVIELSMVESLLNGRTEERRHIFEEAAGITKYKQRRKIAFRKLEATEKDLLRVGDIISEVEKKVNSLKRQVRKAQRYQSLTEALKRAEIKAAVFQYSRIDQELEPLKKKYEEAKKNKVHFSSQLAVKESEIEALRTELIGLEQQLSASQKELNEINGVIRKKEEEVLLSRERLKALTEREQRICSEKVELQERLTGLREKIGRAQKDLETLHIEIEEKYEKYENQKNILETKETNLHQQRIATKEVERKILGIVEELSNRKRDEDRLLTHIGHLNQRLHEIKHEQHEYENLIKQSEENIAKLNHDKEKNESQRTVLKEKQEAIENTLTQLEQRIEKLKEEIYQDKSYMDSQQHRLELLKRLIDRYEDYPEGVRHLIVDRGKELGYRGTLADVIAVEEKYRPAIESALGEATVYLIAENSEKVFIGINALNRSEKKGVVTFLPLDRFSNSHNSRPVRLTQLESGIVGWADELVSCEPTYRPLLQTLLGNCLVVEKFQDAVNYADQFSTHKINFVALTGELVTSWGAIKGGSKKDDHHGFVGRVAQLKKHQNELKELEAKNKQKQAQKEQLKNRIQELCQEKESTELAIKKVEEILTQIQLKMSQTEFEKKKAEEQLDKGKKETIQLSEEIQKARKRYETCNSEIEQLENTRKEMEQKSSSAQDQLDQLERETALLATEVHNQNLALVQLEQRRKTLEQEIEHSSELIREISDTIKAREKELVEGGSLKEMLGKKIEQIKGELQEDFSRRDRMECTVATFEQKHSELKSRMSEKENLCKKLRADKDAVSEAIHDLELRISELTMKAENLRSRIKEEYEWDIINPIEEPVEQPIDLDQLDEEIQKLKNRIKNLGPVNLLALKEYEEEKKRLEFLQHQRSDLIEAEENLKETVNLINRTAREKFIQVFQNIRQNFIKVFQDFFNGGEADLILAKDADPLEADIEIIANPKGKRLDSLTLLSGGEKALTAISLLFAIYLIKPSPFCILDEVDAPLDDANIQRFINALKQFSHNTQFIVVTHNKLTMKAADCLYGITMEEDGISKVVSVKLENEAEASQN